MKKLALPITLVVLSALLAIPAFSSNQADKMDELMQNFDPLITVKIVDTKSNEDNPIDPIITPELQERLDNADPRSTVSYNSSTGIVTLDEYVQSAFSDKTEAQTIDKKP